MAHDAVPSIAAQPFPAQPSLVPRAASAGSESSPSASRSLEDSLKQAEQGLAALTSESTPAPLAWEEFSVSTRANSKPTMPHQGAAVEIELGRTELPLADFLQLQSGSVVALDTRLADLADIYIDQRLVGRGEMLVLDGHFCLRVTELFAHPK